MMTDHQHPLVTDYLTRLRAEASRRLPTDRAGELVADIRDHLREAAPEGASEAEVRNAVDRLGGPTELVDEAGGRTPIAYAGPPASAPTNRREMAALAMLVLSVVTFIVFPVAGLLLIAGLILAFTSTRWSGTDKALATAVYVLLGMPGVVIAGLGAFGGTNGASVCTGRADDVGSAIGTETCTTAGATGTPVWVGITVVALLVATHVYTAVRLYRHARVTTP
jgi:uncharacterized membrane protein